MWKIQRSVRIAVVGLLVCPAFARGNTSMNIGPLAEVDEVAIQVMVGDSLALERRAASGLFGNDVERVDKLKAALVSRLSGVLSDAGIRVASSAEVVLDVSMFGGTFAEAGPALSFYLIEVSVCRQGAELCVPERSLLGVARNEGLQVELLESCAAVVRQFIDQRARYRAERR